MHAFQVDWTSSEGYREPAAVTVSTDQAENQIGPEKLLTLDVSANLSSVESTAYLGRVGQNESDVDSDQHAVPRGRARNSAVGGPG